MKFSETVSDIVDKGIAVSKKIVGQAGDAVQKFSDMSVVRLEKRQFEVKRDAQLKELGRIAAAYFITDSKSELRADDSSIQEIISEIKNCDAEIARREAILKEEVRKAKNEPKEKNETEKKEDEPNEEAKSEVSGEENS